MQALGRSPKSGHARLDSVVSPATKGSTIEQVEAGFASVQSPIEHETPAHHKPRVRQRVVMLTGLVVLVLFIASLVGTSIPGKEDGIQTVDGSQISRVRRSWKSYTEEDKQLYLSAVQMAMENGYHYRFVQIHMARMNRVTSHGACAFILWHRRFIHAYENMLRSLAPEFQDLTLPYWNYFEDTNQQLASNVSCDSLEGCSQFLRDMGGGGLSDGPMGQSMQVGHLNLRIGTCVSKGIAGHACNHPNGTASGQCPNCVMRGNWTNPRKIVQTLGTDLLSVLNVYNRTENYTTSDDAHLIMSRAIETSFHNVIHTTLNSTMRYTSSAFDPIFMGHHSMVDLTQLIFNRCKHVPNASVVIDWKNEPRDTKFDAFNSCDVRDGVTVVAIAVGNNSMQMTYNDVKVEEDPFMNAFFSGYGDTYRDIANAEDLGPGNSYTYAIDAYLENLLERHNIHCPDYLYASRRAGASRRLHASDEEEAMRLVDILATCGEEIMTSHPSLSYKQRLQQEGLIKCLVVENRSGGVLEDYADSFRSMMLLQTTDSPYCVQLLRDYRRRNVDLLASRSCLRAYGEATGVDLLTVSNKSTQ